MSQKLFFFGATGQIGFVIVQGFAARSEFQVTAAIRPDSREKHAEKIATLEAAGITLVDVIDYTDVSALTEVLTGFQTVVSTLSGAGISGFFDCFSLMFLSSSSNCPSSICRRRRSLCSI
eukprot:TRINITY_DN2257_c0_g4_i2.p2 TRINITY_DN2257_c0_g4~~TRINITY_DN2257_c0_g4_i2.p2  ORF type:complete len:120 (+),score=18.11 TRINITY_DN2257_c0_g4_i2:457-816(+)